MIRPATVADRQFIRSGWSASMRAASDLPLIPMRGYSDIMHPIIDGYLDAPQVKTIVSEGELGVLFGFLSYNPDTYVATIRREEYTLYGYVLYCYVADPFRRHGVANTLLEHAGIDRMRPFGYAVKTAYCYSLRRKIPRAECETKRARYMSMEAT